jgi:hypothetical protein
MSILSMVLPALVPAVSDGVTGVVRRLTGADPAEPQSVADRVELIRAESDRLQTLAALDRPHGVSPPYHRRS